MKAWFLADAERLARERRDVEELARASKWFTLDCWALSEYRLSAKGTIRAGENEYPVRLLYPDQFPDVPAWVEPQDPKARWSRHQYGAGGVLCLELRPDNWSSDASGAEVLASAYRLLDHERPGLDPSPRELVPSAENVGALQLYDLRVQPLLVGEGCAERLKKGLSRDLRAVGPTPEDGTYPLILDDADDRAAVQHAPDALLSREVPVFVSLKEAPREAPGTRAELLLAAGLTVEFARRGIDSNNGLVLFANPEALLAFRFFDEGCTYGADLIILPDDYGARSARSPTSEKAVAIVGTGSVGSKMAESLLRSGIHRLTLVDGDVMLPTNLERHALDWRDVGFRKVLALKRRLLTIVPGAEVRTIAQHLSWQRSAKTHAAQVDAIASCNVIVDATGSVPTALFLGALAASNDRSLVSVEVFEGGIGALVASSVPKLHPPYAAARAAFLSWCDKQGAKAPEHRDRPYEALGPLCQRRVRQPPLDISVPKGGEWISGRAEAHPCSWT